MYPSWIGPGREFTYCPIYLRPPVLFAGFFAIVQATVGHFDYAAVAIFVAMAMDTLDGRVARITSTASDFW